jgi:hypothetical protein
MINWRMVVVVAAFLATIFFIGITVYFISLPPQAIDENTNEKYCLADSDCACGVHIKSRICFYGNEDYVDTSEQCPDFCNGIAAHLIIKCINNECAQINRLGQ